MSIRSKMLLGLIIAASIIGNALADGIVTAGVPAGQLPGTTTNDNANAGNIGQVIGSNVVVGSAVNLTTSTTANVTSVSLTAGDWDVYAKVCFHPAVTTSVTVFNESISTTSATNGTASDGTNNNGELIQWSQPAEVPVNDFCLGGMKARMSLASTTTVFLTGTGAFTASTLSAYGNIIARRAR